MKNNLVNQDIKTDKPVPMSYEALKAEHDALKVAVDGFNQELYGKGFEVAGWHLNGDLEPLDNWFGDNDWNPETPATTAALAAIEARGVEKFAQATIAIGEQEEEESIIYAGKQALLFAKQMREAK